MNMLQTIQRGGAASGGAANRRSENRGTEKTGVKSLRGSRGGVLSGLTAVQKPFAELLEKTLDKTDAPPPSEEAVSRLLDGVHEAGDALNDRPFLDELMRYKEAVRLFMTYVVENGFDLQSGEGVPASQKPGFKGVLGSPESKERKSFPQVKVVDEKLEKLAEGIITGQLKKLDLLAGIEEINGILVDMLE